MSNSNLQLKILATNWGFDGTLKEYITRVKQEGYDGIETWWPMDEKELNELAELLDKNNLRAGFLCGAQDINYTEHLNFFKKMVDAAATNTLIKPLYINCHSGRDYFSYEQNKTFIDHTIALSKKTGIKILHETHRSRIMYSAPAGRNYFDKIADLRITFDVSHWCNVSESLLANQPETIRIAIERTDHIHARIGHPEGPQVNDPRAPEWKDALDAHLAWWDKIVELKKASGELITILTEFGPADYMPTEPYTKKPLADQWGINVFMKDLLRKRYS
ncbi:MAG TPA: TIM barrel protein [Chitinophagaceae bacterium]|nr:TIM barrel protein [Chitinophagaceae bacterium]